MLQPANLRLAGWLAVAAVTAACGGSDATGPGGPTPVASLALSDLSDTLLVRESFAVSVRALDARGEPLTDRPVTWTSSDSTVLSVTGGGVITAVRAGTATLSASTDSVDVSRRLTVRALRFANVYPSHSITCGREKAGDLWCWGEVPADGFGNGSSKTVPSPLPRRAALGHRFVSLAISRLSAFACGIEVGGTVSCWGANAAGELGDGTTTPHYTPMAVTGLSNATAIAAGLEHACALTADGNGYCWGANSSGQLGDGTRGTARTTPVRVQGLTGATSVTAGNEHSCAVTAGGAMCWGSDVRGELGHDTTYDRVVPLPAATAAASPLAVSAVTANESHTCALANGEPWCWGTFDTGVVDGWDVFASPPLRQADGHQFVRLADGHRVQCGLEATGVVWCWSFGHVPLQYPSAVPLTEVAIANTVACALDANGIVSCWDPRHAPITPPDAIAGAPAFVHIAAGSTQTCGLTAAGALWCWPNWLTASSATLASGATVFSSIWGGGGGVCGLTAGGDAWCQTPTSLDLAPQAIGYSLAEVASGLYFACGRTAAGAAFCWGSFNTYGQLGDGTRIAHTTPAPVAGGIVFTSLAAGFSHTCGGTASGSLYCWGIGYNGELGDNGPYVLTPQPVTGGTSFSQLASGGFGTCGLGTDGSLTCWRYRVVVATAGSVTRIAVGDGYSCGLDAAGTATCWTRNVGGWLAASPASGIQFATIAAGDKTACGITASGATWCWGDNTGASLGSPDAQGLVSSTVALRVYGSE